MTSVELLVAALGLSVATALAGCVVVGLMERRVRDAALRERAWTLSLHAAALPPLLVGLVLLTPAPTIQISASAETMTVVGGVVRPWVGSSIDREAVAAALLATAALASILRGAVLAGRTIRLGTGVGRTAPASADLVAAVERAARDLGVRSPRVRIGSEGVGPLLVGFRRPVLVLPPMLASRPEATETRAACAHELAHLKRGDHRAVWGEEVLLVLLACNPMLRVIRDRRGAAREEACDALALAQMAPDARRLYARALIDAFRAASRSSPRPALALIHNPRSFAVNRLNAILNPSAPAGRRTRSLALAGGVMVAALAGAASLAVAAQREAVVDKVAPADAAPVSPNPATKSLPVARPVAGAAPRSLAEPVPAPALAPAPSSVASVSAQAAAAVVTNPSFAQTPAPQYPAQAAAAGITEASVSLSCTGRPDGAIADCSVVSEDPAGVGFGAAAVEAAERARLVPRPDLTAGGTFRFTVRFRMS